MVISYAVSRVDGRDNITPRRRVCFVSASDLSRAILAAQSRARAEKWAPGTYMVATMSATSGVYSATFDVSRR